jgi:hypothetical protein
MASRAKMAKQVLMGKQALMGTHAEAKRLAPKGKPGQS